MEKTFRITIIHERSTVNRQIKAGKTPVSALRQAKNVALRLELGIGGACRYELTVGGATLLTGDFKEARSWLAERTTVDSRSF